MAEIQKRGIYPELGKAPDDEGMTPALLYCGLVNEDPRLAEQQAKLDETERLLSVHRAALEQLHRLLLFLLGLRI